MQIFDLLGDSIYNFIVRNQSVFDLNSLFLTFEYLSDVDLFDLLQFDKLVKWVRNRIEVQQVTSRLYFLQHLQKCL